METQICRICGETKTLDRYEHYVKRGKKYHSLSCKDCRNKKIQSDKKNSNVQSLVLINSNNTSILCSKCGVIKNVAEFPTLKRDARISALVWCKDCFKKYDENYSSGVAEYYPNWTCGCGRCNDKLLINKRHKRYGVPKFIHGHGNRGTKYPPCLKKTKLLMSLKRKGIPGKKHTEETKQKISISHIGLKQSPKTIAKIIATRKRNGKPSALIGRKASPETIAKMKISSKGMNKGTKNGNWRGGTTQLNKQIRRCDKNKEWIKDVFYRDQYTCQCCGDRNGYGHTVKLEAHHIKGFSKIIKEHNIKSVEEALMCKELWDINNGVTLCYKCHLNLRKKVK